MITTGYIKFADCVMNFRHHYLLFEQINRNRAHFVGHIRTLKSDGQISLYISYLRPAIISFAIEGDRMERLLPDHLGHRIG